MAVVSLGTILKRGTASVAEVLSLGFTGFEKAMIDTTDLNSASRTRTFISGLRDYGSVEAELNFLAADTIHELLEADFQADATQTYSVTWPDAATTVWSFTAHVSNWGGVQADMDAQLKTSVAFKITGVATID